MILLYDQFNIIRKLVVLRSKLGGTRTCAFRVWASRGFVASISCRRHCYLGTCISNSFPFLTLKLWRDRRTAIRNVAFSGRTRNTLATCLQVYADLLVYFTIVLARSSLPTTNRQFMCGRKASQLSVGPIYNANNNRRISSSISSSSSVGNCRLRSPARRCIVLSTRAHCTRVQIFRKFGPFCICGSVNRAAWSRRPQGITSNDPPRIHATHRVTHLNRSHVNDLYR